MKPIYQKLKPTEEPSVLFYEEELPRFIVPWHYHPEIEILMIVKSTGTSYIGSSIRSFQAGDICIIGENLPHWWKSDAIYSQENSNLHIKANIIQFKKEILNTPLLQIKEMNAVKLLLENASRGIWYTGKSRAKLGRMIQQVFMEDGIRRIANLLELLDEMASEHETEYLCKTDFLGNLQGDDFSKFNKVYEYMIRHYNQPIRLEEVAEKAHMAPTAFCRYFKKRTGKSFTTFMNEFRVGHAEKRLLNSEIKISMIAQECGFNNLSHFNEQFRKITGYSPKEYRAKEVDKK